MGKERERNISWLPLLCAPARDPTQNLLVYGRHSNQLSHPTRAVPAFFKNHPNMLKMQICRSYQLPFPQRFRFHCPRAGPRNLHFSQHCLRPLPHSPAQTSGLTGALPLSSPITSGEVPLQAFGQSSSRFVGHPGVDCRGQDSRQGELMLHPPRPCSSAGVGLREQRATLHGEVETV